MNLDKVLNTFKMHMSRLNIHMEEDDGSPQTTFIVQEVLQSGQNVDKHLRNMAIRACQHLTDLNANYKNVSIRRISAYMMTKCGTNYPPYRVAYCLKYTVSVSGLRNTDSRLATKMHKMSLAEKNKN